MSVNTQVYVCLCVCVCVCVCVCSRWCVNPSSQWTDVPLQINAHTRSDYCVSVWVRKKETLILHCDWLLWMNPENWVEGAHVSDSVCVSVCVFTLHWLLLYFTWLVLFTPLQLVITLVLSNFSDHIIYINIYQTSLSKVTSYIHSHSDGGGWHTRSWPATIHPITRRWLRPTATATTWLILYNWITDLMFM